MITYKPEIDSAVTDGVLAPRVAARLEGAERREPFSIYFELRMLAWLGVTLIVSSVGMIVAKNLDRIGPLAIVTALGFCAAAVLGWAAWRKHSGRASAVDDYLVLLGALLLAATIGVAEAQFKLLDHAWHHHFLVVAVAHALVAYYFDSRSVLTLSIAAFATWVGLGGQMRGVMAREIDFAVRAIGCALAMLAWRETDRRLRTLRTFEPVFEHFAANFAFAAFAALFFDDDTRLAGVALALVLATALMMYAIRSRREPFAIYALIYAVIAIDVFVIELGGDILPFLFIVVSTIAAIVALFLLHVWFRKLEDA